MPGGYNDGFRDGTYPHLGSEILFSVRVEEDKEGAAGGSGLGVGWRQ